MKVKFARLVITVDKDIKKLPMKSQIAEHIRYTAAHMGMFPNMIVEHVYFETFNEYGDGIVDFHFK